MITKKEAATSNLWQLPFGDDPYSFSSGTPLAFLP